MNSAASLYHSVQFSAESPVSRLVHLYNIGISASEKRDHEKLTKVLMTLNNNLNEEAYPKLAKQLKRIYQHLLACAESDDFNQVTDTLTTLSKQWAKKQQH